LAALEKSVGVEPVAMRAHLNLNFVRLERGERSAVKPGAGVKFVEVSR
jgi:hypothetical protein